MFIDELVFILQVNQPPPQAIRFDMSGQMSHPPPMIMGFHPFHAPPPPQGMPMPQQPPHSSSEQLTNFASRLAAAVVVGGSGGAAVSQSISTALFGAPHSPADYRPHMPPNANNSWEALSQSAVPIGISRLGPMPSYQQQSSSKNVNQHYPTTSAASSSAAHSHSSVFGLRSVSISEFKQ